MNRIYFGDNLPILERMDSESVNLIYIDPPFNTGKPQARTQIKTIQSERGDRIGFQGRRYETIKVGTRTFSDLFDDYLAFLEPRLREAYRILAPNGSLYFHIDYREVHYCRILLDRIFGRECFLNEIIWAYDYGGRPKSKWPPKHDNILLYTKNPDDYTFNYDAIERIPYMAPGLVGSEKAARGKLPTDTWWHTIVPTNSAEKTGYPTQKPLGILKRIVQASSNPGDLVLDFFAGSGTTGEACLIVGREFVLIDNNLEAMEVMARRFDGVSGIEWIGFDPRPFQRAREQSTLFDNIHKSDGVLADAGGSAMKYITDPEVQILASIAAAIKGDYVAEVAKDPWAGSPFAWIRTRPSRQVGKIGEQLVAGWCAAKGLDVTASRDPDCDRVIAGHRIEIKFSTLWASGVYKFQQIRDQNYEYLICLGLSPFDAHCWVIPKHTLRKYVIGHTPQHTGKRGTDTFWLSFPAKDAPPWLSTCGGTLGQAFQVLKRIPKT